MLTFHLREPPAMREYAGRVPATCDFENINIEYQYIK